MFIIVIFISCVIPVFSFTSLPFLHQYLGHSFESTSKQTKNKRIWIVIFWMIGLFLFLFFSFLSFCWFHSENATQVANENAKNTTNAETKNLNHKRLSRPMHFPVHGQWWSYPLIHTQQSKQWLVVSSSTIWQREHILFLEKTKSCWNK